MPKLSRMYAPIAFLSMWPLVGCKSGSSPHAAANTPSPSSPQIVGAPSAARPTGVALPPTAIASSAPALSAGHPADLWNTPSATINPKALPLGSQKYVTSGPQKGYVFTCDAKAFQFPTVMGATKVGSWVGASTFDVTAKPNVQGTISHAGQFSISTDGVNRNFLGNALPMGVTTGVFPTDQNDPAYVYDQNPSTIDQQTISFSVPLNPVVESSPSCTGLDVGITLDGVELSGPLDSSGRDEMAYEMMDSCTGMSQPGGVYHRHALSNCIPHIHENNALVGYALDGFGIFSPYDANGKELTTGDLDECHGTTSEINWNGQKVNMYHYVLTRDFPYSVSCFRGKPVAKNFPERPKPTFDQPPPPPAPSCMVYVSGTCHADLNVKSNVWFSDNYNNAGSNSTACLKRAGEYQLYCKLQPGEYANSSYMLGSDSINSMQVRGPGSVSYYGLNWTPLPTGPFADGASLNFTPSKDPNGPGSWCWVYVAGQCRNDANVKVNQWFYDNYNGASGSEGRCLNRAREYQFYCGLQPGEYVDAGFQFGKDSVNSIQFRGPGNYTNYGINWAPLP
ncbi:MAG: YHYH protein [Bdellovibrionota bacterium]